jgi:hypothetical protein
VGGKLSVAGVTGIKILSEIGVEAGIITASDGSSGSMLFHGVARLVHSIDRTHSRHRPGRNLA